MPEFNISNQEIQDLAEYIYRISGIDLDQNKGYLLQTRLKPLLVAQDVQSYRDLLQKAQADRTGDLERKIIDAISTQETLFFRDSNPFDLFKFKIIPDLIDIKTRSYAKPKFKIWSAACSTGQEVYSIAIALLQVLSDPEAYDIEILGTDISEKALALASYGKYNSFEIERGLPKTVLNQYFNKLPDGWRVQDRVRSMAKFKQQNLMRDFSHLGKFDVIFCRNVAIYFSQQDKVKLFARMALALENHGYLLLGGSESLTGGIAPQFESKRYLRATYYHLQQGLQGGSSATGQKKLNTAEKEVKAREYKNDQKPNVLLERRKKSRTNVSQPAAAKQQDQAPASDESAGHSPQPESQTKNKQKHVSSSNMLHRLQNKGNSKTSKSLETGSEKQRQSQKNNSLLQRLAAKKNKK